MIRTINVPFYYVNGDFGKPLSNLSKEAIARGTIQAFGGLKLSVLQLLNLPTSREGRELQVELIASCQGFNKSRLCSETSIKTPKDRVQGASGLGSVWRCWESVTPGDSMELCAFPPCLACASIPSL